MNKFLALLLVATVCIFLYSCEKERGAAVACMDTGSATFTPGKTIRFMNCSKNYDYTKWSVSDDMGNIIFTESTDTLKHFAYNFNPGTFNVKLEVWTGNNTAVSDVTQQVTVTP